MIAAFLASRIGRGFAYMGLALIAGLTIWLGGGQSERARQTAKRMEQYRETRKRADDADIGDGDPSADRNWLRDRGEQ
jgi:hypothetical protein